MLQYAARLLQREVGSLDSTPAVVSNLLGKSTALSLLSVRDMSNLFERAISGSMSSILAKNKYRKVEACGKDTAIVRDAEPQILDADVINDNSVTEHAGRAVEAEGQAAAADVPATATLLGEQGPVSDVQAANEQPAKKSKGFLGCLNFQKGVGAANEGLPTAFNGRQTILKRLAKSAKKVTPPPAATRPARAPKRSPYVMHAASWRTNVNELCSLLAAGGDCSKRDKAGLTCLHYAAWQGSVDAVQILLDAGADINARDPEGMLPLHFAAWFNRLDVAALLLDRGSYINPPTKGIMWPTTPLIYAAKMGHVEMVSLLMDRGAQVAATYKAASSALHEAAWNGHTTVVAEMMRRDVSHDVATGKSKYRPLHLAAMNGSAAVVQELVAKGAWVDARSQLGRTPLHLACEKGHIAAAVALVAGGADLLAKDRHGFTPLHLAVDNNHVQLAKLLLDKGATPDAADQHGALPLNFAHDPDFYKLLRAVRWYGAASVPSGNNPSSSRYFSTGATAAEPPGVTSTETTAMEVVPLDDGPTAFAGEDATTAAEIEPATAAAAATTTVDVRISRAQKKKVNRQSAGSWFRAHMPSIRSHKAAVIVAASQPGNNILETPEATGTAAAAEGVPSLAAAMSAVQQALSGRVTPGGRVSPAGSHYSTESAAAHAAAASMARAAVEAVVARAAAEAALEEVAQEQRKREASASRSESPVCVSASKGSLSVEQDNPDDAKLLEQIRTALAAGATRAFPKAVAEVEIEDYMRTPASISIDPMTGKVTPGEGSARPSSPGDAHTKGNAADQVTKHTIVTAPAALPVSTNLTPDTADTAAGTIDNTPTRSPNNGKAPTIAVSSTGKPGSARKEVAAGAARYAAPTASTAAKKTSKANKRKTSGAVAGSARAVSRAV